MGSLKATPGKTTAFSCPVPIYLFNKMIGKVQQDSFQCLRIRIDTDFDQYEPGQTRYGSPGSPGESLLPRDCQDVLGSFQNRSGLQTSPKSAAPQTPTTAPATRQRCAAPTRNTACVSTAKSANLPTARRNCVHFAPTWTLPRPPRLHPSIIANISLLN